jgi:hypothetical protein
MKKKKISFIAVLPVMVACAKEPIRTSNPPEPASTSNPASEPVAKKPEPPEMKFPPASYSERKTRGKECYVDVAVNPPYQVKVSCTAELEPPVGDSKWCSVELADDNTKKTNVACGNALPPPPPPPPPPPAYFPKREKSGDGKCYVAMAGNPPYREEVSCTEVPKPHNNGGCLVDMKRTPEQKIVIDCKS